MRFQRIGGASAGRQQGRQFLFCLGQCGGSGGAVLAGSTGQRTAHAPHPHLFFGVAEGRDGRFGRGAGILGVGACGLTPQRDGPHRLLIQFTFGTHNFSLL